MVDYWYVYVDREMIQADLLTKSLTRVAFVYPPNSH